MNTEDFVEKLRSLYRSEIVAHMKEEKFPKEIIDDYKHAFFFRSKSNHNVQSHDPLIGLVENYDGSKVHIGMISFDLAPFEDDDYFFFANFEGDLLGIDKNLREIRMIEYGSDNHILYNCASNSDHFMTAILMVADILQRCDYDRTFDCSNNTLILLAEECSETAGGKDKYLEFYKMLLNCEM